MEKSEPSKWSQRPLNLQCGVCGAPAADVLHYGSFACYSCRAFFRRAVGENKKYDTCARGGDDCVVDIVSRTNCKKCRLMKCFEIGMKTEKVAKRKNKPRKLKGIQDNEPKPIGVEEEEHLSTGSPVESNSSGDSYESVTEDVFLVIPDSSGDNTIDICDIAERCVLEELSSNVNADEIMNTSNIDDDYTSNTNFGSIMDLMPSIKFTIEEEYRLCELEATRDLLCKTVFETLSDGIPMFKESIGKLMLSRAMGIQIDVTMEQVVKFCNITRNVLNCDLINGGKVCRVLENLNELKNVPNDVKYELFQSTLGLMDLCNRAYLKANKDKASFVEQKKAAGMYNEWFEKLMEDFVINKFDIPTLKGFAIKMFDSPWAKTTEDEVFFTNTLDTIGNIVRDDVKLGTLYLAITLLTPDGTISNDIKENPHIQFAKQELCLLMFRYLKNKYPENELRSESEYYSLMR